MAKTPMTTRGAELLRAELHRLKTVDRPNVITAIAEARAHGDLSENAEYDAARNQQGFIEGRISELEAKLGNAQVVDPKLLDADGRCVFGATVDLEEKGKGTAASIARELADMGFTVIATRGTARAIQELGVEVAVINKVAEGRPHVVDMIKNGDISLIVNTVEDSRTAVSDSRSIRTTALARRVTYYTTVAGAKAACTGMKADEPEPYRLQDLHAKLH